MCGEDLHPFASTVSRLFRAFCFDDRSPETGWNGLFSPVRQQFTGKYAIRLEVLHFIWKSNILPLFQVSRRASVSLDAMRRCEHVCFMVMRFFARQFRLPFFMHVCRWRTHSAPFSKRFEKNSVICCHVSICACTRVHARALKYQAVRDMHQHGHDVVGGLSPHSWIERCLLTHE